MAGKKTKLHKSNGVVALPRAHAPLVSSSHDKNAVMHGRVTVNRAYKMYVGGAFVRSESGRYFQVKSDAIVKGADPGVLNMPRGSRKDVRDAVLAAKGAEAGWAARTAFNRGQILYRLAEMMESRRDELVTSLVRGGEPHEHAEREVSASVDRCVYYAGFADKFQALVSSSNPVAGPHFGFSVPEPMGVVGVVPPARPTLLALVSTVLPVLCGGNTCVALVSEADPRTALVWAECIATSDMPGGVVNLLSGHPHEIAPVLARHREVMALDAWLSDAKLRASLERDGADNVKRVKTHAEDAAVWLGRSGEGVGFIERFLETKTVWHPVGV
jgi:acyl-CoA reductase-like NAD-dependent aldehyde dehydrogenase